jgi:VanZ family protein
VRLVDCACHPPTGCRAHQSRSRVSSQRWLPPLLWAACILILTSIPGSHLPALPTRNADKIVHLAIYCVLGWLTARAWSNGSRLTAAALAVVLLISCFGALDEWHQQFIPQRSMDLLDWAADTTGATIGVLLALATGRKRVGA